MKRSPTSRVASNSSRTPTTSRLPSASSASTYNGSGAATPRPLRWPTV
ncbi:MAG: hypothetical protein IPH86_18380 [bacterium]|nr:hypothetical protein [bacterium]